MSDPYERAEEEKRRAQQPKPTPTPKPTGYEQAEREKERAQQPTQPKKSTGISSWERAEQLKRAAQSPTKTTTTTPSVSQVETSINKAKDTIKQAESYTQAFGSTITWGDTSYDLGSTSGWKAYKDAVRKAKSEINEAENQLQRYKTGESSEATAEAANEVIEKANEVIEKAGEVTRDKKSKKEKTRSKEEYEEQKEAIDKLIKKGVAKREPSYGGRFGKSVKEGSKIVLTVPVSSLTDELLDTAKKAGFDIKPAYEAPSFKLFEWGQDKGERVSRTTQYYATALGSGERAITNTLGRLYSFVSGKNVNVRSVSQDTVTLVRDLSPREKRLFTLGTIGGNYLGNYVALIPVGAAASVVFQGAKNIATATGATTPAAVSRIASEIAKHPNLAKAAVWGPMVGIEADKVYADYKKGRPINEIYTEIAMRGGTLLGQIQGLETGFKLPTKIKEWALTRGKTAIPPEELWRTVTMQTGELPTYTGKYRTAWSSEFKDLAKDLSAEKYLGEVAPNEYRVWHGTRTPFKEGIGETLAVQEGDSLAKFPGLFVAPEPSPLRLPSGAGKGYRLGLPGVGGISEIASIDALVDVMPDGLSRTAAQSWLKTQLGTKTAYIPPVSMITAEMEALIPPGSKLVKVGAEYYTNWAGHRVLVNQYVLIGEGVALPAGSKAVELSKLISSAPSIGETYLTFGIVPPTSMLKSMELTPSEITALSKTYGIPESQVKSILKALSYSLAEVTEDTLITEKTIPELNISDLTDILETPGPPSIDETTPPGTTPEPISEPSEEPTPEIPPPPPEEPKPFLPKSKPGERRDIRLRLFSGPKEKYRVKFSYPKGQSQTLTVEARSFPEAVNRAQRSRRGNRYLPSVVDITKVRG